MENNTSQKSSGNMLKRFLPILVLVAVAALVYWQGWYKYLTIETLALNREFLRTYIENNFFIALLAYAGIYALTVALSFPGALLLTLAGGFLFGALAGGLTTVIAATVGATVIFLIAKTALAEPLAASAGKSIKKLKEGFQEDALSYMFFLRLVPIFPFWLVNLAPGILGVPLTTYLIGTFFGIMPGTFAYSYAGVGLDSVINAQLEPYQQCLKNALSTEKCSFAFDPSVLITKELIIAFAALGVVALIPVVLRKLRRSKA
ncbi:MAG: TVP38/TMEM64 family protein [Pseudomonadota bacterium]